MNLIDLDTFVRVARAGTLTGAAKALGVPKSTVSRRVARLEDALGMQLLLRTARSVSLTTEGEHLVNRTGPALADIDEASRELEELDAEPRGDLRITAPQDFGASAPLGPLVAGYHEAYPRVRLDMVLTNRVVDLVREQVDVALRPSPVLEGQTHLTGRRLFSGFTSGVFASPRLLERVAAPRHPDALAELPWIGHPAFTRRGGWAGRLDGQDEPSVFPVDEVIRVNDFGLLASIVAEGTGFGALPSLMAEPDSNHAAPALETDRYLRAGTLTRVLPRWTGRSGSLWIVWPKARHMTPKVRAFVDHAVSWADELKTRLGLSLA